jgi:hypothetical protein
VLEPDEETVSLQVEIPAGESDSRLSAREVVLERALGQPVTWRFVVRVTHDDAFLAFLVALLESGQVKANAVWNDSPLGSEAVIVHAQWSEELAHHLVLEAHATSLGPAPSPAPDPDPFTPRWRVHDGVSDLLKLAQRFAHVAALPNWVKTPMQKVKLAPGDFTSVVQDGLSDWAFFSHLLDHYGMLGQDAAMKPLVLTGSVEEAAGEWLVTYGSKAAYAAMNDVSNRHMTFEDGSLESPTFAHALRETGPWRSELPSGSVLPLTRRVRRCRPFTADAWSAWSARDLPLFTKDDERFVYRIVDRLWPGDTSDELLEWTTQYDPLPEGAVVAGPQPPLSIRTWTRIAEVTEVQPKGPWIKAKLEGFESNANIVQARLNSSYSGTNGKRGLHLVPEPGTKVVLTWTGRVHEPLLVLGNVREEETEHAAPSLWLEALATKQYADVLVKEIGKTTVESDLELEIQKATTMKSTGALKVTAEDTADIVSTGALKLEGKDTTDIVSTGALKLEGKDTTDIVSTGELTVAGSAATEVSGASGLTLKSDGDAALEGANVGVKAQSGAEISAAGGNTIVKGVQVLIN